MHLKIWVCVKLRARQEIFFKSFVKQRKMSQITKGSLEGNTEQRVEMRVAIGAVIQLPFGRVRVGQLRQLENLFRKMGPSPASTRKNLRKVGFGLVERRTNNVEARSETLGSLLLCLFSSGTTRNGRSRNMSPLSTT